MVQLPRMPLRREWPPCLGKRIKFKSNFLICICKEAEEQGRKTVAMSVAVVKYGFFLIFENGLNLPNAIFHSCLKSLSSCIVMKQLFEWVLRAKQATSLCWPDSPAQRKTLLLQNQFYCKHTYELQHLKSQQIALVFTFSRTHMKRRRAHSTAEKKPIHWSHCPCVCKE